MAVLKSRKNLSRSKSWAKKFILKNNNFFFNRQIKKKTITIKFNNFLNDIINF